jgi:hypothetical protein
MIEAVSEGFRETGDSYADPKTWQTIIATMLELACGVMGLWMGLRRQMGFFKDFWMNSDELAQK